MKKEVMVITRGDLSGMVEDNASSLLERIRDRWKFLALDVPRPDKHKLPDNLEIVTKVNIRSGSKRQNGKIEKKTITAHVLRRDLLNSMFPIHYSVVRALEDSHIKFKRIRLEGWRHTAKSVEFRFTAV